ncbi:hypothetical protein JCM14469_36810 [Desulfatiferula olefinivorans]
MNETEKPLAVIGPREAVRPYRALGAVTVITDEPEVARHALVDLADAGHRVILITDDLLRAVQDTAEAIMARTDAAVTALPDPDGGRSFSTNRLRDLAFRAIGFNPG